MKKIFYLLFAFCILVISTSCKKENPGYSFPIYSFNFYLVNKVTGENLIGLGGEHSYHPGEVGIAEMYGNDPSTKTTMIHRETYSIDQHEELGYYYSFDYEAYEHRIDHIFYLDDLKPDTITIINTLSSRGIEIYINSILEDHFTQEDFFQPGQPATFYKIEKEL